MTTATSFAQWRSPPPQPTPGLEPAELPNSPAPNSKLDLHPSFLPPCEHGAKEGDRHAHAFDLLSLAGASAAANGTPGSSVPTASFLSSTRPAVNGGGVAQSPSANAKARRMSSSTTGVLGRGKLGLTGVDTKDHARPTLSASVTNGAPIPSRRLSSAAAVGSPQLFDFAKTDRRPSVTRARTSVGSLPTKGIAGSARGVQPAPTVQTDDMELDMEFGADDDDEDRSGNRSGSAELDMDMDDDGEIRPDLVKLALGTGSGGIKGRRKGMVFKCETCSKEYRHPSCLVKHRWEHSPHWREPTQISMSKHQQVQMLEAAAILAHMDPLNAQGRSLPTDKSLWPAILSPLTHNPALRSARSVNRELPKIGSPASTGVLPLTPSSMTDSVLANGQPRKSSPGSDSTSSMGADSEAQASPSLVGSYKATRPMGINDPGRRTSGASSVQGPGTPQSLGSLPDMNGLHFHTGSTPSHGTSPLPNRSVPLSLGTRASMIGGGMFGSSIGRSTSFKVPDSSLRGGVAEDDEDQDELRYGLGMRKSSSEEADERRRGDDVETGFEIDNMEL